MTKEIGRLTQGMPELVEGTNTIHFLPIKDVPKSEPVTYARVVASYRPQKEDPYRIRVTAGGNLLTCEWDIGTRTAGLVSMKCLINSILSTRGA